MCMMDSLTRDYVRGWTRGLVDVLVVDCSVWLWIVDCGCTIMAYLGLII